MFWIQLNTSVFGTPLIHSDACNDLALSKAGQFWKCQYFALSTSARVEKLGSDTVNSQAVDYLILEDPFGP